MKVSRRSFLGTSAAGLAGCLGGRSAAALEEKPNIVFILADDLGWADTGYHGAEILTPHIDRLAAEGVRLEQHYACPTCTPARVGLMTGRYPSRYGVLSPAYGDLFDDDTVTLAAALGACGYDTAISGKWHMGSPPESLPRKYGFHSSYGYFHGQIDPYTHLYKNGEACWHRNDELLTEEGHATDLITEEAVRVITAKRDKPFFLYVAYSVPHFPLDEPEEWTAPYKDVYEDASRRLYAASVTHMDDGIGRILGALDSAGVRDNTLLIFSSDNGGQRSWHSMTEYHGRYADKPHTVLGDNRPLRGWKGEVYEGGVRVPALASWPGTLQPAVVDAPMHIVDWMPTLCGLAGYSPANDPAWDGQDIWPFVSGTGKAGTRTLYWKTPGASALRRGAWKLVAKNGAAPELYNIAADPNETRDRAGEAPERLAELQALLARIAAGDRPRR